MRKTRGAAAAAVALLAAGCGSAVSVQQGSGQTPTPTPSAERTAATVAASPRTFPGGSLPASPLPRASASSCHGASAVQAENAGTPNAVPALASVEFVSATRGWVAGAGRVLATADGGRTWQRQYDGAAQLYQVDFTDAAHGWAVGTAALLATADGGRTWTPLPEPCPLIDSVHFVTSSTGYAVAGGAAVRIDAGVPVTTSGGELLVTTDGGQTWRLVAGAPAQVQSACFSNTADGYLGTAGKIWRSTDGGLSWAPSFTEPPKASGASVRTGDSPALECAGPSAAWALFLGTGAAMSHAPYIAYATQDARTWHVLFEETYIESASLPEVHAPDGPGTYPGPFSAISPARAAFVGWTPPEGFGVAPLDMVTGGTQLAQRGNVGGLTQAYGAAFVSTQQGWVVGTDQTSASRQGGAAIAATTDGGRTWVKEYAAG